MKHEVFEEEINSIYDDNLKQVICDFLDNAVPDYFWEVPASSSGKYHPSFDNVEGGLINHTKMVCAVFKELCRLDKYQDEEIPYPNKITEKNKEFYDCGIIACIIHDSFKSGYTDLKSTVFTHPEIAAIEFRNFCGSVDKVGVHIYKFMFDKKYEDCINHIYDAVLCHMGQWGNAGIFYEDKLCEAVHLSDYIASRKFFDKFKDIR